MLANRIHFYNVVMHESTETAERTWLSAFIPHAHRRSLARWLADNKRCSIIMTSLPERSLGTMTVNRKYKIPTSRDDKM